MKPSLLPLAALLVLAVVLPVVAEDKPVEDRLALAKTEFIDCEFRTAEKISSSVTS